MNAFVYAVRDIEFVHFESPILKVAPTFRVFGGGAHSSVETDTILLEGGLISMFLAGTFSCLTMVFLGVSFGDSISINKGGGVSIFCGVVSDLEPHISITPCCGIVSKSESPSHREASA